MFLRSALIKLPRVTHLNLVRACTNQVTSAPTHQTESSSDWKTIYKFPQINLLAKISKLKVIQSAITVIGVPVCLGLESFQVIPSHSTELYAIIGTTGAITLSIYSLCAANIIGYIYVNPVLRKIRFAYIDFWGRRQNIDLTLNELVDPEEKLKFNTYTAVKTTTAVSSLKLLKYGTVLDTDMFFRLFGDIL